MLCKEFLLYAQLLNSDFNTDRRTCQYGNHHMGKEIKPRKSKKRCEDPEAAVITTPLQDEVYPPAIERHEGSRSCFQMQRVNVNVHSCVIIPFTRASERSGVAARPPRGCLPQDSVLCVFHIQEYLRFKFSKVPVTAHVA